MQKGKKGNNEQWFGIEQYIQNTYKSCEGENQ